MGDSLATLVYITSVALLWLGGPSVPYEALRMA